MVVFYLYFDGGSRGNPGISGSGAVLFNEYMQEISYATYECGIDKTNNHAEYMGLVKGIELVHSFKIDLKNVIIRGDSMLVVKQCRGEWKVKEPSLAVIFKTLKEYLKTITKVDYPTILSYFKDIQHVPRKENSRADQLSNIAMDSLSKKL
jgi:ribonuclease HI